MSLISAAQIGALIIFVVVVIDLVHDLITSCRNCSNCLHAGLLAPNEDTRAQSVLQTATRKLVLKIKI